MRKLMAISLLSITLFGNLTLAAETKQTGVATVLPGNEIAIYLPDNFSFDTTFIPSTSSTTLSKLLSPEIKTNQLIVHDLDPNRSFSVTMSASDLTTSMEERIRFSELQVVTLSASNDYPVDGNQFNTPPLAPNLTAPLDCDISSINTWQTSCMSEFTSFKVPNNVSSTLTEPLFPGQLNVYLDTSNFNSSGLIKIEDDIIQYTDKEATKLTGVSNIDVFHANNTSVQQYWVNSEEETIMEDNSATDTGLYSIGFGFLLNINTDVTPGNYQGILTFTLITS